MVPVSPPDASSLVLIVKAKHSLCPTQVEMVEAGLEWNNPGTSAGLSGAAKTLFLRARKTPTPDSMVMIKNPTAKNDHIPLRRINEDFLFILNIPKLFRNFGM